MWVYFDQNGSLLTALEHGNVAREGKTSFEINAYFKGYSEDIDNYEGKLTLQKPSDFGRGYEQIEYDFTMIKEKNKLFYMTKQENKDSIQPFSDIVQYNVFSFNFHHDDEGNLFDEIILDRQGLWQAVIDLYDANGKHCVMGMLSFNVQPGAVFNYN